MDDTAGTPGNLDPRAQEFRPRNHQITLFHPHIYHPYPSSPFPFITSTAVAGYQPAPPLALSLSLQPPPPPPPPGLVPPSAAPTRALLLSSVPMEATEQTITRELEAFGEIRRVLMGQEGMVTVHYYDLRHAEAALTEIQEQHMHQQSRLRHHYSLLAMTRSNSNSNSPTPVLPVPVPRRGLILGRTVWAQFVFPFPGFGSLDSHNQGTIVIFNLDSQISASQLKQIFQPFGAVKEVRETPAKKHQRFVEYYDIRDADKAIKEMNGKEINGKRVLIEFSRPGGQRRFPPPSSKSFSRSISDASSNSSKPNWSTTKNSFPRGLIMASPSVNGSGSDKSSKSTESSATKRNSNKGADHAAPGKQQSRNKSFKGRHKVFESQFWIKEDAIFGPSSKRDARTTVMIKNIPNKYSQKLLLNMLDNHCTHWNEKLADGDEHHQPFSSYDFVYLPIDFNNKCNVGYGFVNFTSPEATWRIHNAFHKKHWEVFNSRKICEITYARLQGLEALKEHFKNSKFACDTDEYLPVMFDPPRDGKQMSEPVAIGGQVMNMNMNTTKGVAIKKQEDDDEDVWSQLHGHDGGDNDEQDTSDDSQDHQGATTTTSSSSCSTFTITSAEANGV